MRAAYFNHPREKTRSYPGRGVSDETEPDVELLTSPLQQPLIGRAFIIGGPLGLAIAIVLSVWSSMLHVRHTAMVQAETVWIPGEPLAVRALVLPETMAPVGSVQADAWVQRQGRRQDLTALEPAGEGTAQGTFVVPSWEPGPAELHLRLQIPGSDPRHEVIPIEIAAERAPRKGTAMVSGSNLQYGDDSDPQSHSFRIDVRASGRLLSEFDNTLFVRVLHSGKGPRPKPADDASSAEAEQPSTKSAPPPPAGAPYEGPVHVVLVDGTFMDEIGDGEHSPRLFEGSTSSLGLVRLEGMLQSEVLRLEVRLPQVGTDEPIVRLVRMVSFAGGVRATVNPDWADATPALQVHARGLSQRRPVYVDLFGPDGAWAGTVHPPFAGGAPRDWVGPTLEPGIVQFEAYQFTTDPGESTDVERVQLLGDEDKSKGPLHPLIEAHEAALDEARVDRTYDAKIELAYLQWLKKARPSAAERQDARAFLLGTLPLRVHGPPLALATRQRDLEAMAKRKRRWTLGLRVYMLGGGGLFLLAMTIAMIRAHAAAAASTTAELQRLDGVSDETEIVGEVERARRAALVRGFGVIAIMAAGLLLTTFMLESLLWVF